MEAVILSDVKEIYSFLSQNRNLHIYSIGDLDDFYRPHTCWYGLKDGDKIMAIILLYTGLSEPTLLALSEKIEPMDFLLKKSLRDLPHKFYAHLNPDLIEIFEEDYKILPQGRHYKMTLTDDSKIESACPDKAVHFDKNDSEELTRFYRETYPGNWFDSRMLESGHYFGLRIDNRIASVAGVHVYSSIYKVAALGNIATHPDFRSRGLGKSITAYCCRELLKTVDTIGLNVSIENLPAIRIYEQLGFEPVTVYGEYIISKKT